LANMAQSYYSKFYLLLRHTFFRCLFLAYTIAGQFIFLLRLGAGGFTTFVKIKAMTIFAHKANLPGWVSYQKCISRHIFGNNRPGTNHGIFANGVSTNDGSIGTYRSAFFHQSFHILISSHNGTSGIYDVGKNHGWPQKNIVFTFY